MTFALLTLKDLNVFDLSIVCDRREMLTCSGSNIRLTKLFIISN
jgi:hypothetical protein